MFSLVPMTNRFLVKKQLARFLDFLHQSWLQHLLTVLLSALLAIALGFVLALQGHNASVVQPAFLLTFTQLHTLGQQ